MDEPIDRISVYGGKYTLLMDPKRLRALRYGEPWRDLVGDSFVMALGQEILALRAALEPFAVDGCSAEFQATEGIFPDAMSTIRDGKRHWIDREAFENARRVWRKD